MGINDIRRPKKLKLFWDSSLGSEATYKGVTSNHSICVIAKRPEQLFSLGEEKIHGEKSQFEFRLSEVSVKPK